MLIVLRGNSGSGKTTTATLLREAILASDPTQKVAVLEQDYLRRSILKEKEAANGDNIQLIEQTALFALQRNYHVILEGILRTERYESMLESLAGYSDACHFFYFDIPLSETLKRHSTKPNVTDFKEADMRKWFKDKDLLTFVDEHIIGPQLSQPEIVQEILRETTLGT